MAQRLARRPDPGELKDLTDFMHGFAAPLVECSVCGVVTRAETNVRESHTYEEDPNDIAWMRHVLPRYVNAFRNKKSAYKDLLRPHAEVLELGPHLGGFLEVAEEWGWRPTGVDIGKDTADFCNSRGLLVRRQLLSDYSSRTPIEALFIWNCFEQLADPFDSLREAYQMLAPGGLLVLRVPNVWFYRALAGRSWAEPYLAYNNLLGFPYLYGYTADSLDRLVTSYGFVHVRGFNSELVTMPFADVTTRIGREQQAASSRISDWTTTATQELGHLTGPWIELVYRKQSEKDWYRRRVAGAEARALRLERRIDLTFLERAA